MVSTILFYVHETFDSMSFIGEHGVVSCQNAVGGITRCLMARLYNEMKPRRIMLRGT